VSGLLQNLVTEVYNALIADDDFRTVDGNPMVRFIVEDDGDINTQLSTALGRLGLVCIIDLVDGVDEAPDSSTVVLNPVSIVLEVSEKVLTNRKGVVGTDYLTLRQALAMLMAKLKQFTYSSNAALILTNFKSVMPPRGADAAYQIFFETAEALKET